MKNIEAILENLENAPAILEIVREIPENFRKRRPQPEKWSAHGKPRRIRTLFDFYNVSPFVTARLCAYLPHRRIITEERLELIYDNKS